jgi:Anion-transporting ATPase
VPAVFWCGKWFLKFADISTKADDFVESATMNPAFEESAMFENMVEMMLKRDYEAYVFDTAPTANARRLLGMSKVYALKVEKMLKSRQEARTLREMLSFSKKKKEDPLLEYLYRVPFADGPGAPAAHRRCPDSVLLRQPPRGAADRGDHALHRMVP